MNRREFIINSAATGAITVAGAPFFTSCAHPEAVQKPTIIVPKVNVAGGAYFQSQFGIDEALVRRVLRAATSLGGDFADIYFQHKVSDYVGFEDGQVNRAYAQVDLGAGIRVLKGEQTGYAFTEELTPEALIKAAQTAASIASAAPVKPADIFTPVEIPRLYATRPVWMDVAPKDKINIARRVGEKMMNLDSSIIKASTYFGDSDEAVLIANTEGVWAEDIRPMTLLYANCAAEKDGRIETNGFSRSARRGSEMYSDEMIDEIAKQAVERTILLFDAKVPPAGEMPVVLAPATSGILLHEAMGHGFEADFNRKEISIFSAMMNKPIAADFVTIVDTGLEQEARGAVNVDDEGTVGQSTTLVENGKLVSYLHDRISAKHYKVPQTGNGRREDFRCIPMPRMRVTTMENGPHHPEEIIRSVKKGLYAVDFSNGEVAIGAGDYSFYVKTGYLIEDGKLTAPVKDVNLIGNGPDSLKKITMVGNDKSIDLGTWTCGKDGQSVPVGLGLPTVKVSAITVGGVNS
ncbi:MAG: TldD/PmbA family protein [Deltaproteobacteria bacterium]|nr:TldD/PmbA family protein [Deltaproteobacteria bacterium]MBN2671838.1 TldD/PmbA family protein [Deltaproteobacteria bacterium]